MTITTPAVAMTDPVVSIRYLKSKFKERGEERVTYSAETRKYITDEFQVKLHDGNKTFGSCKPTSSIAQALLRKHGFVKLTGILSAVHNKLHTIENPLVYRSNKAVEESKLSIETRYVYFRECEKLVKTLTGAEEAHFINHAARSGTTQNLGADARKNASKSVDYLTAYATFAHADYTEEILPRAYKIFVKRGVCIPLSHDIYIYVKLTFFIIRCQRKKPGHWTTLFSMFGSPQFIQWKVRPWHCWIGRPLT